MTMETPTEIIRTSNTKTEETSKFVERAMAQGATREEAEAKQAGFRGQ